MRVSRIALIIIGLFFFSQQGACAARGNLALSISFDKSEYEKTEPIFITFTLKNHGKKPVYVNKRFFLNSKDSNSEDREIYLLVTSPLGEALPYKISQDTGFPKSDYFVLLNPKDEITSERKRNIRYFFDFKEPGVYEVKAVYQNVFGEEIGLDAFKGELVSKVVKIKIVEEEL